MNLEDESLLSAFLDDELDAASRLKVETALLTEPGLSERLQQIASVRQALARLPRPVIESDLSPLVLARVEASPLARFRRAVGSRAFRRRAAFIGSSLIAASVALVLAIPRDTGPEPNRLEARGEAGNASGIVSDSDLPAVEGSPASAPDSNAARLAENRHQLPSGTNREATGDVVLDETGDREFVRQLLDRRDVRRLLVVVDAITPDTLSRVEGAIQETGRADPRRAEIRVAQGIEIDPERPGEAVVYAVVLEGLEYEALRDNLDRHSLENVLEDAPAAPAVVTQLADVGRIMVSEGPHSTPLGEPPPLPIPLNYASKSETGEGTPSVEPDAPPGDAGTSLAHGGLPRASTGAGPGSHDLEVPVDSRIALAPVASGGLDDEGPGSTTTVFLVWVTTRQSSSTVAPL